MSEKIGKYEILERIGRGGMGTVFKARDPRLKRHVALKVISQDVEITDDLHKRFLAEAEACAALTHPNIVTVYESGEDDGRLFMAMEFLDGRELKELIATRVEIAMEDKVSIMVQLCDALDYAHRHGVVHRDVKPGNIFFLSNGIVKIIDFGVAKMTASPSATRTGMIMGTIRYMSPEQVRGHADARSDQYSLGAVFYEMLSFRPPYLGENPLELLEQLRFEDPPPLSELNPFIPPNLAAVVERSIQKKPEERYPDLAAMKADLEAVEEGLRADSGGHALNPMARLARLQQTLPRLRELDAQESAGSGAPAATRHAGFFASPWASRAQSAVAAGFLLALLVGAGTAWRWTDRGEAPGTTASVELPGQVPPSLVVASVSPPSPAIVPERAVEPVANPSPPEAPSEAQQKAREQSENAIKARSEMEEARFVAEIAHAGKHAPDLFNVAIEKEKRAGAALANADFAAAATLFEDARNAFRSAADRSSQSRKSLIGQLDEATRDAGSLRREALAADAGRLASDRFAKGSAKQAEAERFARSGDLGAAIKAQKAAIVLYRQALETAETTIAAGPKSPPLAQALPPAPTPPPAQTPPPVQTPPDVRPSPRAPRSAPLPPTF